MEIAGIEPKVFRVRNIRSTTELHLNKSKFVFYLQMTSVERVVEYCSIEKEKLDSTGFKLEQNWPQHGQIKFENVSFSYAENLPDVLKNLSFEIKSGEKVGIIGRTGAGKSSIIQALYRMAEPKGDIIIDGVNIKKLGLHDLRKRLSIIPVKMFNLNFRFCF